MATTRPLRVGVLILPDLSWAVAADVWRRAEAMEFSHAWTYDHLTWRGHRDGPWFGAIPTLTAAALATKHIRLGPLVASPNFRHPLTLAKDLITLDDISGGRVTCGIGAGSTGWDATMMGHKPWSAGERAARFAEFIEIIDALLREPAGSHEGQFYPVHEARTHPGCVQLPRIPLAVAASGPRGMRLAATHAQIWVTTGSRTRPGPVSPASGAKDVGDQIAQLEEACTEVGRDPRTLDRLVVTGPTLDSGLVSPEAFGETVGRYAEIGVTDLVVPWPRSTDPYHADPVVFERIFG